MRTSPRSSSSARRPSRATYGISSPSWKRIPVRMQSQSPSDKPSSISTPDPGARADPALTRIVEVGGVSLLSVAMTAAVFALAATFLHDSVALVAAGVAGIALVSALAAQAVRRDAGRAQASDEWQRKLRSELMVQTAFLDDV